MEDKTKSILFGTKRRLKGLRELNIRYKDIEIKQNYQVKYIGCLLENSLSGESIALQAYKNKWKTKILI